ncbi:MAG: ABC-F family ATP-binding cassette domain-containing protein [Porphyromonas sp.]|nr:ABC-F family ATP-binding cassette domain-containing protein [Porphyromonas sp.]
MLSVQNLTVYFGADVLFSGVSFVINASEKVALTGFNGAGKTTLMNIISGKRSPSEGIVSLPSGSVLGYLSQHLLPGEGKTVWEETETVFGEILKKKEHLDSLSLQLTNREDFSSDSYMELAQKVSDLTDEIAILDSENYKAQIEKTLFGLGFVREDLQRPTSEFSGGWRMRIELAKILLRKPDLLLLDEPTNHLDVESIVWLENFLKSSSSALLLVSHDKAFVDNVTTRTLELSNKKIYDYKVPYSQYLTLREERYEQELRAYENQQKSIRKTEEFIERFRSKATKAVQVQSRVKQLEKIERIEVDRIEHRSIHFRFPMRIVSGAYPLKVEDLKVSFGDLNVLKGVNLEIKRGEKIAVIGKNGAGKTTLLRAILGEVPHSGEISLGHNVEISYFSQNAASLLDPNLTIYDTIDQIAVGDIRFRINDILGAFMFGGETAEKKVGVLSGGEKSRLAMIKLLLEPGNLLILDEPTNHLDIHNKAVLKEAILNYEGTVLIVSHDRDFLSGLVTKVIEVKDGIAITHLGGIDYYLQLLQERIETPVIKNALSAESSEVQTKGREEYEKQKETQKRVRKLEKELEQLEHRIQTEEKELKSLEEKFAQNETSPELLDRYSKLSETHKQTLEQWEKLSLEIEECR